MKLSIKAMIAITIMILIASLCFAEGKASKHSDIDWSRYESIEIMSWIRYTPPANDPQGAFVFIMNKVLAVKTPKRYTPKDFSDAITRIISEDGSRRVAHVNYYTFKPGGYETCNEKHAYEFVEAWVDINNLYTAVIWRAYLDDEANITRVVPQVSQFQLGQDGAAVSTPEESWEFIKMIIDGNQ